MKKQFDFIGKRLIFLAVAGIVILAGVVSFFVQGFNVGQDFTGGTEMTFVLRESENHDQTVEITGDVEKAVAQVFTDAGATGVRVTANAEPGSVTVDTAQLSTETQLAVKKAMGEKYYFSDDEYSFENISGKVSRDLRDKAIKGVAISSISPFALTF